MATKPHETFTLSLHNNVRSLLLAQTAVCIFIHPPAAKNTLVLPRKMLEEVFDFVTEVKIHMIATEVCKKYSNIEFICFTGSKTEVGIKLDKTKAGINQR